MNKLLQWLCKRTPNSALFYGSLMGVLVLSLSSYYLSAIALDRQASAGFYTMAQYSVMALLMLLAWHSSPVSSTLLDYRWLFIVAVVARVALFAVEPYASNDVDRYLFDGRIAVEGLDPYRINHNAHELKELREQWQPPAEHAKYVTLYPPLALAFFYIAAAAGIANAVIVWKFILLTAGLMTLWLAANVLQHANKLQHIALVALSPLLILETHVGLHLDALSTLAVIGAVYCWQRQCIAWAGLVIGTGALIKILPIMLLLPLMFTLKKFKHVAILVMTAIFTIITVYLITIYAGFHPVGSIGIFFEKWRFGAPLFVVLDNFLSGQQILGVMLGLSTLMCSLVAYFCWHHRRSLATNKVVLFGAMQLVIALPLIVSPVIFPWYLMPLVPLMALYPNRYLIIWTLLMPLTYEVIGQFIASQIWQPAQWPLWLIGLLQLSALLALVRYCYRAWRNVVKVKTV
jgi:alpha-1,6-mannosyltransferase